MRQLGYVDNIVENIASGWVNCENLTDYRVDVRFQGQTIAWVVPDLERSDLTAARLDQAYGFRVALPLDRLPTGEHTLDFVISSGGVDVEFLTDARTALPGLKTTVIGKDHWLERLPDKVRQRLIENPRIEREIIADSHLLYRPDFWRGDFIFVDGQPGSQSTRYRVENIKDGLVARNLNVLVITESELWRLIDLSYTATFVIFFRCGYVGSYRQAQEIVKRAGSKVVYDIDDYIFDLSIRDKFDGLNYMNSDEVISFEQNSRSFLKFIRIADTVTVSTVPLKIFANQFSFNVGVYRNSITQSYELLDYDNKKTSINNDANYVIGYYSGSLTHQADFRVVEEDLAMIMLEMPNIFLRIVGDIDFSEFSRLSEFRDRIALVEKMSHADMMVDLKHCDLVLAPLEIGNPFCESKSQLKYFEAALFGIPCAASATLPFKDAIEHGVDGYLVGEDDSWKSIIFQAMKDRETGRMTPEALRSAALSKFSTCVATQEFLQAIRWGQPS